MKMNKNINYNKIILIVILKIYLANSVLCPEFIQGHGRNKICFILTEGKSSYDDCKILGASINARLP
jgi:hypothetical protein